MKNPQESGTSESWMGRWRTVNAIGLFEMAEYLGLALIFGALAVTALFLRPSQSPPLANDRT